MARTTWRVAGALALGHVVLMMTGLAMDWLPSLGDARADVADRMVRGDATVMYAGGYVETLGFLALVPVLVFLGRALGRGQAGTWAAQTGLAAGVAYVAVTVAPGMSAGGAALYAAQNGADLATVTAVNDIRNMTYFLSGMLLGLSTAGLSAAGLADATLPRWLAWSGLGTAAVLVASVPAAGLGLVNVATVVWVVWFVALGVVLIRHRPDGPHDRAAVPAELLTA